CSPPSIPRRSCGLPTTRHATPRFGASSTTCESSRACSDPAYNLKHMATLTAGRKYALRQELEAIVGRGGVLSDPDELLVYESDGLTLFRALADFVVFPTSPEHAPTPDDR